MLEDSFSNNAGKGYRAQHGLFGEMLSRSACSLLSNPGLVKWHPQGRGGSRQGRMRSALPDFASTDPVGLTFSGSSAVAHGEGVRNVRSGGRSGSAPCGMRYCDSSPHLSGQEILARKQLRSVNTASRSSSSRPRTIGGGSASFGDSFGADHLEERDEVASSSHLAQCARQSILEKGGVSSPAEEEELLREVVRQEMIARVGGSMEAFRMMDISGSGRICLQEFTDGIERIGLPWQEITGFRRMLHLFRLFDQNKDGLLDLEEFFPSDTRTDDGPKRASTPDFWDQWCDWSDHYTDRAHDERLPIWEGQAPAIELQRLFKAKKSQAGVADRRRWMSSMFRRLKSRGKSDAQVRECIALHLPRGTGPQGRDKVHTFSDVEVKNCKRQYNDGFQNHVRSIQKEVYTMREQRQHLSDTRQHLQIIMAPLLAAQRYEEEKKAVATQFQSFSLLGHPIHHGAPQESKDNPIADNGDSGSDTCETPIVQAVRGLPSPLSLRPRTVSP